MAATHRDRPHQPPRCRPADPHTRAPGPGRSARRAAPRCAAAAAATESSWVTSRIVWPSACTCASRSTISAVPVESSDPVGSSASSSSGTTGQRARDRESLPLAAGHRHRVVAGRVQQAELVEQVGGAVVRRAGALARDLRREGDVLQRGHLLQQPEGLEHDRDVAAAQLGELRAGGGAEIEAGDHRPAVVVPGEPGDDRQQRRLARPGRADQGDELAAGDVEVDAAQRADRRRGDVEGLADVAQLDDGARRAAAGQSLRAFRPNTDQTLSGDRLSAEGCWHPCRRRSALLASVP